MSAKRKCRKCGGKADERLARRYDYICRDCHNERQRKAAQRRRDRNRGLTDAERADTLEMLERELDRSKVYNGKLRLRVYDLERAFRRAKEAGLDIPDPDDYSTSGSDWSGPGGEPETGAMPMAGSEGE